MDRAKPFEIPKREVWEAYKRVRANKGTAGVCDSKISRASFYRIRIAYLRRQPTTLFRDRSQRYSRRSIP